MDLFAAFWLCWSIPKQGRRNREAVLAVAVVMFVCSGCLFVLAVG